MAHLQNQPHQYRDTVMLPFPCLQTNARFDGGMSGGPVFDRNGRICAVVATGMPPPAEGGDHYSHASLIWPALGLRFNNPQRTAQTTPQFLRSAGEAGHMQVFNLDRMQVKYNPEGPDNLVYTPALDQSASHLSGSAANLPERAARLIWEMEGEIEAEKEKRGQKVKKPVKRVRIAQVAASVRIENEPQWNLLRDKLDKTVRDELNAGNEVELE